MSDIIYQERTVRPFFDFTYEKNRETPGGPYTAFEIEVVGVDKYGNQTVPARLTVSNPAPNPPRNLAVQSAFTSAYLTWQPPAGDIDIAGIEIWEAVGSIDFDDANLITTVAPEATSFSRIGLQTGITYSYWLKAIDTFGSSSITEPSGSGSTTTPGAVEATDITDFSIKASKLFLKTVILEDDVWTNNSPVAGEIAWNAHTVYYHGVGYPVAAGHTALTYVYFDPNDYTGGYQTSNENPINFGPDIFQIATNTGGIHDLAWLGVANAVIGSAHIQNLAVTDAKILSLAVEKILAGRITARVFEVASGAGAPLQGATIVNSGHGYTSATVRVEPGGSGTGAAFTVSLSAGSVTGITMTSGGSNYTSAPRLVIEGDGTGAAARATLAAGIEGGLQSVGFTPGYAGWSIKGDGSAEFNNVLIRGTLKTGVLNTDVRLENSRYPGRAFPSVLFGRIFTKTFDAAWSSTSAGLRTAVKVGTGGTPSVLNFLLLTDPDARFFGVNVANTFVFGTGFGIVDGKRVGTDGPIRFLAQFRGQVSNAGPAAILYRIHSDTTYPPPANTDTTEPWVLQDDGFASQPFQPFYCTFDLVVPPLGWVEFGLAPLDDNAGGNTTKDVFTKAQLIIQATNF